MNSPGPKGTSVCGWKCSKLNTVDTLRAFLLRRRHCTSAFTQELCVISFHACECGHDGCALQVGASLSPSQSGNHVGFHQPGGFIPQWQEWRGQDWERFLVFGLFRGWGWSFMPPLSLPHRRISGNGDALAEVDEPHVNASDGQTPGVPRLWEGQAAGKGLEMRT